MKPDIKVIRGLTSEYHRSHPAPPEPSKREAIESAINETTDHVSIAIERAAREGKNFVTSHLLPLPQEGGICNNGYSYDSLPKYPDGRVKVPNDFSVNPTYLNEINRRLFDHFSAGGFSVSLEQDYSRGDPPPMSMFIRW